jgi:hypothetical protein
VDDVPVKVDYDRATNELYGINWADKPWPPIKAMHLGRPINKVTFDLAVKAYKAYYFRKITEREFKMTISKLFGTKFYP